MSFRRFAFIAIPVIGIASMGAVAAGARMAANGHGFPFHPPGPPPFMNSEGHRAHLEAALDHLLDALDATEEQQAQIEAILDAAFEQGEELRGDHEARHEQLKELFTAEEIDREALEELRTEAIDRFDEGSQLFTQVAADVAEVLTVEQRQELIELVESRRMQ